MNIYVLIWQFCANIRPRSSILNVEIYQLLELFIGPFVNETVIIGKFDVIHVSLATLFWSFIAIALLIKLDANFFPFDLIGLQLSGFQLFQIHVLLNQLKCLLQGSILTFYLPYNNLNIFIEISFDFCTYALIVEVLLLFKHWTIYYCW